MRNIITRYTIDQEFLRKWRQLWEQSIEGHFFNTPDWFVASCKVYGINKFVIITIEEQGELVLVLPLVKKKVFGIAVWTCLGGKFVNKSPLLIKDVNTSLLQELSVYLQNMGDFYLQEVSSDIVEILSENNKQLIKKESSVNPYLYISPDPFQFLSSKNKSQIRGIIRKNEGALKFKTFIGDPNALESVFELDMRSTKTQQGKGTFITIKDKQFFRELIKRMPHQFVIDLVYYNNVPVVYGVGFVYKKIFHASNTAYDADYRFLRPGKLLAQFRLKRLQEEVFNKIDFGRGNSILKQEFTKLSEIQYNIFFVQSALFRKWILSTQKIYDGILQSKYLYSSYLFFKKNFLYR